MKKLTPFGTWSCFQNILVKELLPVRGRAVWVDKNTSVGRLRVDINSGRIFKVHDKASIAEISFPLFGTIEVTNSCNLKCAHCLAVENSQNSFSFEKIISLIDELADGGVVSVGFSGGEPLLRSDLTEIIEYATRKRRMQTLLFTNGTLLKNALVQKLKRSGLSWIGVSVDSAEAKKHDEFRGVKGAFSRAVKGIRNSIAAGLNVWIRSTLTNKTRLSELDGLLAIAKELKVNRLYFIRVVSWGNAYLNNLSMDGKKRRDIVEYIMTHPQVFDVEEKKIKTGGFDFLNYRQVIRHSDNYCDWGCGAGTIRFRINNEGYVLPCPFFPIILGAKNNLRAENILEKNFGEIWRNSEYLNTFRRGRLHLQGRCGNCHFADKWCYGGCRAEAIMRSGAPDASDPLCQYNE